MCLFVNYIPHTIAIALDISTSQNTQLGNELEGEGTESVFSNYCSFVNYTCTTIALLFHVFTILQTLQRLRTLHWKLKQKVIN